MNTRLTSTVKTHYECEQHKFGSASPVVFLNHLMDSEKHGLTFWPAVSVMAKLTLAALNESKAIQEASAASEEISKAAGALSMERGSSMDLPADGPNP